MKRKSILIAAGVAALILAMALPNSLPSGADEQYPEGMVSYWKFDEGSGTIAYDSANANHASIHGASWVNGQVGGALSFDGVNDYVGLTSPLGILDKSHTVEMWVKVPSTASGRVGILLGDYALGATNVNWEIHARGQLRIYWAGSPNLYGRRDLRDDLWHHIVFVRDKDKNKFYAYIDGKIDIAHTGAGSDKPIPHRIGRDGRAGDVAFDGRIDEVAIYDRALTLEEIQEHYENGLLGLPYRRTVPVAVAEPGLDANENLVLDGSKSFDTDGTIVSWEWTLTNRDPEGNDFALSGETTSVDMVDVGVYDVTLTVTDNDDFTDADTITLIVPRGIPPDTTSPKGAIHAYRNMLWPPDNQDVQVEIAGYVFDELSALINGSGTGVASASVKLDGADIPITLNADGSFTGTAVVKAVKGATYLVELYAADTSGNGPALIDSTNITVPESRAKGSSGRN